MKKIIVAISIMAIPFAGKAQSAGNLTLGGALGFSSTNEQRNSVTLSKESSWEFSPEAGYFITDNIQAGIALTLRGDKFENPGISTTRTTYTGAGLYGRYFFGEEAFKPFAGINLDFLPSKQKTSFPGGTTTESSNFTFGANINAGFGYLISPKFMVFGQFGVLGYSQTTDDNDGKTSNFGFDFSSLGNRFNIGFYFIL